MANPAAIHSLTDLVHSSAASDTLQQGQTMTIPSAESITNVITSRSRAGYNSTYIGSSVLVSLNPREPTADVSDSSAAEYEDRAYRRTDSRIDSHSGKTVHAWEELQPHPYDLAARVYASARRTQGTQSVVFG